MFRLRKNPPIIHSFRHYTPIRSIIIIAAILSLGACVSVDVRKNPDFGLNGLLDADPLLAGAALSAEYVQDVYASTFLLTRIAEEYMKQNQPEHARELIRRAIVLSQKPSAAANRYQLQTELARFYIIFDEIPAARKMLQGALDQTLTLNNEVLRGSALESIIEEAFQAQDSFPNILRSAIDYVFVLQDPVQRVDELVKISRRYQDLNIRNRSNNLIQQAISAASSINNYWAKANAYVLIARRFLAENNATAANQYITQALQTINSVDVLAISSDDAKVLLDLIVNLAESGHLREANATVPLLPDNQSRTMAQLAIIERSINQKAVLQARLSVQRLLTQLSQQDPDNQNELSLSSLIRLAEIYQAASLPDESLRYARATMPYLSSPLINNISTYRSRLALVLAKNGQIEEAITGAELVPDAWLGSQTLRQIAELLFFNKDEPTKNRSNTIRALLIEAEQLAGQASYLRESALADVAASSFRTGDDIRAIRILEDIKDNYLLGKTLVDAASGRPHGLPFSPDALKKLVQLWSRILAKKPIVR